MSKNTTKKAPAGVTPPPPPGTTDEEAATAAREEILEREAVNVEEARERLEAAETAIEDLAASLTQREWLLVCRKLDVTRAALVSDGSLRLLALAWVKEKREHGGADWDRLLNMTDNELLEAHGIDPDDARAVDEADRASQ